MTKLAPYAKSLTGALIAGLASLQQALEDGVVTSQEGVNIAIATLSALAIVWAIPNKRPILGKAFTSQFSKAAEDERSAGRG